MMNWPTAFVIAVAICAGAFLYNKPSDAAFGGSDRYSIVVGTKAIHWIQFDGNKQRLCQYRQMDEMTLSEIQCRRWKTD